MKIKFLFIALFLYSLPYLYSSGNSYFSDEINYLFECPDNPKGLIVIFPKYGSDANRTDSETEIDEFFFQEGYSSLIIEYNRDFYLDKKDFFLIHNLIGSIIFQNNIPSRISIGGFSVGGNIALSYCIWSKKLKISKNLPEAIFVGDSPIDLEALYRNNVAIVKKNFNERAVGEAQFILDYLKTNLGNPDLNLENYYKFSPIVNSSESESNIRYLKHFNILFFSEPDWDWYKKTIGFGPENLNSFQIERTVKELKKITSKKVDHIKTSQKGFIGSKRHPHSWSIIDKKLLLSWINKNSVTQ